jgi:negative regulator of sigma E activity
MGESYQQRLSELMDDELSEFERRRWLDALLDDPDSRAVLGRYRLIGEVLRHSGDEPLVHPGFRARVLAAIEREPQPQPVIVNGPPSPKPAKPRPTNWKKALAGLSIAASVALLAIYLGPTLHERGDGPIAAKSLAVAPTGTQLASALPPVAAESPTSLQAPSDPSAISGDRGEGRYWATLPPEVEQKLNRYLVEHAEYTSGRAMNRMLPYASFVSYDRNP